MFENNNSVFNEPKLIRKFIIKFLFLLLKLVSNNKSYNVEYDLKSKAKILKLTKNIELHEYINRTIDKIGNYRITDKNGYPTDEFLLYLCDWEPNKDLSFIGLLKLIRDEAWWCPEWGFIIRKVKAADKEDYPTIDGKYILELHTGGWSGNELIVDSIMNNVDLSHIELKFYKYITGGHYYFAVNKRWDKEIKKLVE
ncbi:MAG: hypothetical protein HPY57_13235 [Ignavibacteria bacterium]|nr:hypothetical protein [Ignavibacteria bacterium]